jgi:hypothetical protein
VYIVLATGPGNLPVVWVWTAKTGRFGSRTVQKPYLLHLGRPNPDLYLSTRGFGRVWLDPSVLISGCAFRVSLFIVAFRYATVKSKILTMVRSELFRMYRPP